MLLVRYLMSSFSFHKLRNLIICKIKQLKSEIIKGTAIDTKYFRNIRHYSKFSAVRKIRHETHLFAFSFRRKYYLILGYIIRKFRSDIIFSEKKFLNSYKVLCYIHYMHFSLSLFAAVLKSMN